MRVVGLTGSIGMGKSTAAERFRHHGFAVFDADSEVHRLYAGPLVEEIGAAFPGVVSAGRVDRAKLSAVLLADPSKFQRLEKIVHPRVRSEQRAFLKREAERGASLAVLEIPLLLETGLDQFVDTIVVVSAKADVQHARVLAREGMTKEKLATILSRQMPDAEKRARADFVVDTSGPVSACNEQIDIIIPLIEQRAAHALAKHWQ